MTMADLVALGAPPLPPGHFYRVARVAMADGTYVSIHREARWGSRLLSRARVRFWTEPGWEARLGKKPEPVPVDEAIRTAAEEAHAHAARDLRLNHWIGDHR